LDNVVVSRGNGSLVLSLYRGFQDAIESNLITQMPKIYSAALKRGYGSHFAESLEIQKPVLLRYISPIIKETDGKELYVEPMEIIEDALDFAKKEGIFLEPASSSVITAYQELILKNKITLALAFCILTGSGLNELNIYAAQIGDKKKIIWGLSSSSTTKFEILNLIAEKKAEYGYVIWSILGKNYSKQSIYQHLSELEKKGYISCQIES